MELQQLTTKKWRNQRLNGNNSWTFSTTNLTILRNHTRNIKDIRGLAMSEMMRAMRVWKTISIIIQRRPQHSKKGWMILYRNRMQSSRNMHKQGLVPVIWSRKWGLKWTRVHKEHSRGRTWQRILTSQPCNSRSSRGFKSYVYHATYAQKQASQPKSKLCSKNKLLTKSKESKKLVPIPPLFKITQRLLCNVPRSTRKEQGKFIPSSSQKESKYMRNTMMKNS